MEDRADQIRSLFEDFGTWNILQAVTIAVLFILLYKLVKIALPRLAELLPTNLRIMVLNAVPLARIVLMLAALLLIIPLLFDVTVENLVLILGTIGVALGFALKDFATSAFAGLVAVYEKPYRSGDWVRIGDDYGEVIEIGLRAVELRTADDDVVTIPHSRIWSENIINSNNGENTLMCVAEFLIDPGRRADGISDLLKDVALTSPFLDWERPIVVVMRNESCGTRVLLRAYPFEIRDQFAFISDLTARGRDALVGAGIRIVRMPELAGE
ncbi:small-conductance mechanosensitive channel [Aliiruegeria haliotis]|uniref:Small-conductance mechanosensitive channel n=1 Tax=Aliiruegeria haliotis TaxID=1280846 RepID=A0A2T0RLR8_9RHOB|nr:mechanosensitive ion channel domain-containing protein [Aliiruegeria haliotis]PRY22139.1 small-conductance mechanosensitive channel [Aliiruegeria haliotis]